MNFRNFCNFRALKNFVRIFRNTKLLSFGGLIACTIYTVVVLLVARRKVFATDADASVVDVISATDQNSTLKKSEVNSLEHENLEGNSTWLKEFEAKIISGLAENGAAATLNPEEEIEAQKIFAKLGMNIPLSDKISLSRTLPDPRDPFCKNITYSVNLPKASVIIIFHNEPLSLLLRTVSSVYNRTPKHLVQEIILVDDASTDIELHENLDYFILKKFDKSVNLLRLPDRQGLVNARLAGARAAIGDVLVFLDAHCEVTVQWLEPMLQRIKETNDTLVMPIIDTISQETFEYYYDPNSFFIASFDWAASLTWSYVPERENIRRKSRIEPVRTPSMAGGLFAIDRQYFWKIGSYDEKMTGWGAENFEMAFRIWQCGGSIETIPCSRVGHAYRTFRPYQLLGDTNSINSARFIKVWTDEYKWLFFAHNEQLEYHVNKTDVNDIRDRIELRKKLKCKSFQWYLDNVYPEKWVPSRNAIGYGRVRVRGRDICLDNWGNYGDKLYNLGVYGCHPKLHRSQLFSLTNIGELRHDYVCAVVKPENVSSRRANVTMSPCDSHSNEKKWMLTQRGTLVHVSTGLCLDGTGLNPGDALHVIQCSKNVPGQSWQFEFYGDKNPS